MGVAIDSTYDLQDTKSVAASSNEVPDDVANKMSLFYANPTPMLNTLKGATEKLLKEVRYSTCNR